MFSQLTFNLHNIFERVWISWSQQIGDLSSRPAWPLACSRTLASLSTAADPSVLSCEMGELDDRTSEIPPTSSMLRLCGAMLQPGFPSPGTVDILGQTIFLWGGCPTYGRVSSLIPGLDPLDASSTPKPSGDNQRCLQTLPDDWGAMRTL